MAVLGRHAANIQASDAHLFAMPYFASSLLFETQRRENKATGKNSWCSLSLHLIPLKFSDGMKKGRDQVLMSMWIPSVDSKAYLSPSSMQVPVQFEIKESSHVTHFIQGIGFPPKLILY